MKFFFLFLFLPFFSQAQLPTREVIRDRGIVKIEVWNHQMPPITKPGFHLNEEFSSKLEEEAQKDTIITLVKTWFFDQRGLPVKITAENNGDQYRTQFSYDDLDRLTDRVYLKNEEETFRETVTVTKDSLFDFKRWRDGKLFDHYLARKDSLILFVYPLNSGELPLYIDNRDSNYTQTVRYENNKIASIKSEQWHLNADGTPYSLEVDFKQFERATKRNGLEKSYHLTFKARPDGSLIPLSEHSAPRTNFYYRGRYSNLNREHEQHVFNNPEIIDRTEDIILLSFDVKDECYYESYRYFYNQKEFNSK